MFATWNLKLFCSSDFITINVKISEFSQCILILGNLSTRLFFMLFISLHQSTFILRNNVHYYYQMKKTRHTQVLWNYYVVCLYLMFLIFQSDSDVAVLYRTKRGVKKVFHCPVSGCKYQDHQRGFPKQSALRQVRSFPFNALFHISMVLVLLYVHTNMSHTCRLRRTFFRECFLSSSLKKAFLITKWTQFLDIGDYGVIRLTSSQNDLQNQYSFCEDVSRLS